MTSDGGDRHRLACAGGPAKRLPAVGETDSGCRLRDAPDVARVGITFHLPIATAAGYALLALCAVRAWREYRLAHPAAGYAMLGQDMRALAAG